MTKQELEQLAVSKVAELVFSGEWDHLCFALSLPFQVSGGIFKFGDVKVLGVDRKPTNSEEHCLACHKKLNKGEIRIKLVYLITTGVGLYCVGCVGAAIWLKVNRRIIMYITRGNEQVAIEVFNVHNKSYHADKLIAALEKAATKWNKESAKRLEDRILKEINSLQGVK